MSNLGVEYKDFLNAIGKEMTFRVVKVLQQNNKQATGRLIESIGYMVGGDKSSQFVELIAEDYLYFVDQGRKPGNKGIPLSELKKWMSIRGIEDKYSYAINNNIKKYGIKGIHFLDNLLIQLEADFEKEANKFSEQFENELDKQLKNVIRIK